MRLSIAGSLIAAGAGICVCFGAAEPVPRLLQPFAVTAGGSGFTLVVTGQGFSYSTRVLWDGAALPTRWQDESRLEADVPASRITGPGAATIALTRSDQKPGDATLTLTINPPLAWITPGSLPSASPNQFYSQALGVSGGTPPVRFSLASGAVPPGLHLDGYNGTIVGYPTLAGPYELSVKAADASGATAVQALKLLVAAELRIVSGPALPAASTGQPYSTQLSAEGGTPPFAEWKLTAGALPRGLVLDEKKGAISGTATAAALAQQFTLRVRDSAGKTASRPLSLDVRAGLSIPTPDAPAAGYAEDDTIEVKLPVAGGSAPYQWSLETGDLPAGIALDGGAGALRGTLEKAGSYRATVAVRDATGGQARTTVAFQVAPRLALTVPAGTRETTTGSAFSLPLSAQGGAGPPYAFSIVSGNLPDGLRLNNGRIEGTPARTGDFAVTMEVRDSAGRTARADVRLTASPPPFPILQLASLSQLQPSQQAKLDFRLDRAYPGDLDIVVQLGFNGAVDDPAVLLSTGGRQARLTIAAGQLVPGAPLLLQTGTTAGDILIEAHLESASTGRTPTSGTVAASIQQSANVAATPPQIRAVKLVRTADGFEVQVAAFSPTREFAGARFVFDEAIELTLSIAALTSGWFADERSAPFGTALVYRQNFTVRGDSSKLRGVAVSLSNRVGTSVPASAAF